MSIESLPKPIVDIARQRVPWFPASSWKRSAVSPQNLAATPNTPFGPRATRARGIRRNRACADGQTCTLQIGESTYTSADIEVRDNQRWPAGLHHRIRYIKNYKKSGVGQENDIEDIRELPQAKAARFSTIKEIANPFAIG